MYASGSNCVCVHVCVRVCGLEPFVSGDCGKAFVCYKRGKMETSAVKRPAVPDCRGLRGTNTESRAHARARLCGHSWRCQFMVGESTLEGKDCVQPVDDINSTLNVISDSGLHAVLQEE